MILIEGGLKIDNILYWKYVSLMDCLKIQQDLKIKVAKL